MHDDLPEIEAADHGDMDKARVGYKVPLAVSRHNLDLSAVQRDVKGSSASLHSVLWEHLLGSEELPPLQKKKSHKANMDC